MRRSAAGRTALAATLLLALAGGCSAEPSTSGRVAEADKARPSVAASPKPTPSPAPAPGVGPVTMVFGGDVDLDRVVGEQARRDPDAPWRGIAPRLRAADLAMLNLECALSRRGRPEPKNYTFRGDPAHVLAARRAGVDVLTLANNHTLDYGLDAFADTLAAVRRAGIAPVGAGPDLASAQRPAVFTVNGRRIAFVGASAIIPAPKWRAGPDRPGVADDSDAQLRVQVGAARRQADIVVVYFHWGIEHTPTPSRAQRRAARTAIRAGATLVVGTHPHELQPVEVVDGRLVAWSLGNLVFQSEPSGVRTELLTVTIDPRGGVRWRTDPYLIRRGIPGPDASRSPRTGVVPPPPGGR